VKSASQIQHRFSIYCGRFPHFIHYVRTFSHRKAMPHFTRCNCPASGTRHPVFYPYPSNKAEDRLQFPSPRASHRQWKGSALPPGHHFCSSSYNTSFRQSSWSILRSYHRKIGDRLFSVTGPRVWSWNSLGLPMELKTLIDTWLHVDANLRHSYQQLPKCDLN